MAMSSHYAMTRAATDATAITVDDIRASGRTGHDGAG
jgi:hypothetical protein